MREYQKENKGELGVIKKGISGKGFNKKLVRKVRK